MGRRAPLTRFEPGLPIVNTRSGQAPGPRDALGEEEDGRRRVGARHPPSASDRDAAQRHVV